MDHDHDHGHGGGEESEGGGDMMMHMMYMTFHGGYKVTILWDSWATKTVTSFVFSCIGIFLISVLYECLKFFREKIYLKKKVRSEADRRAKQTEGTENYGSMATLTQSKCSVKEKILNKEHLIQTLLHIIQMALSYGLMLVAMTFNYWLFLSLILGFGCGYLFFGWVRSNSIEIDEHCA